MSEHRIRRILVVEDQPILALELIEILHDLGYETFGPAMDRDGARALAAAAAPDLAFVDMQLKDGWTGGQIAADLAQTYGCRVIFLSANLERAPIGFGEAIGGVPKPYDADLIQGSLAFAEAVLGDEQWCAPPPGMAVAPAFHRSGAVFAR